MDASKLIKFCFEHGILYPGAANPGTVDLINKIEEMIQKRRKLAMML